MSPYSVWTWTFRSAGVYLALELALFVVVERVFHIPVGKLIGPYLANGAPGTIFFPVIWWLRKLEERGASPRRLAVGWGLCTALFFSATNVALLYSAVAFRLINPDDALWGFVLAEIGGVPAALFTAYSTALKRISTRAVGNATLKAG